MERGWKETIKGKVKEERKKLIYLSPLMDHVKAVMKKEKKF